MSICGKKSAKAMNEFLSCSKESKKLKYFAYMTI